MKPSDIYFASTGSGTVFVSKETWEKTKGLETYVTDEMFALTTQAAGKIDAHFEEEFEKSFKHIPIETERKILEAMGFEYLADLEKFIDIDYDALDPDCPPKEKRVVFAENYSYNLRVSNGEVIEIFFKKTKGSLWVWEILGIEKICEEIGVPVHEIWDGDFELFEPDSIEEVDFLLYSAGFIQDDRGLV